MYNIYIYIYIQKLKSQKRDVLVWILNKKTHFQLSQMFRLFYITFYSVVEGYAKQPIYIYIYVYIYVLLYICDYFKKISIGTDMTTEEGNSRNETWHWTDEEIGVAAQSWPGLRVELMAW